MKLLEHQGKRLLKSAGIDVPRSQVVQTVSDAHQVARSMKKRVVLKAQVPTGKRGKSGAILFADTVDEAGSAVGQLLGSEVDGYPVNSILVEECVDIERELYLAVLNDSTTKGPLVLFSTAGGMDIEEVNAANPDKVLRLPVDITHGLEREVLIQFLSDTELSPKVRSAVAESILGLYSVYRDVDAELAEINPLVVTTSSDVVALDAKVSIDAGSLPRQEEILASTTAPAAAESSELEARGRELGFQFIELDGDVGVLANGAGLTMTTLDVVNHYGGSPANFLEIGGDSYTKATPALRLVLSNPRVKSLLVNFCGAFARTDVMTEGVVAAIEELRPQVPIFFTIHGTGEEEAVRLVRDRLGIEPFDLMDDAVRAAVAATKVEVL